MSETVKGYDGDGITVYYNVTRCIHAAECVKGLPATFDPDRRPWIDPQQAENDAIAAVIHRCPTGALHFTRTDGGAEEETPEANTLRVVPDGPLYVRGDLQIKTADGTMLLKDTRVALCRCGASKHKPFCDNSHLDMDFADDGSLRDVKVKTAANGDANGTLSIQLADKGPYLLQGPFTLTGAEHEPVTGGTTALCRCGASSNKPFCDGSHREVGFEG